MTIAEKLVLLRQQLANYPVRDDCVGFADKVLSPSPMSFFPGGLGVYQPTRDNISTFVLGSDWGTEASFNDQLRAERIKREATVAGTDKMLRLAGFDLKDCLYTNAWPLMRKSPPEQGHHPMRDDVLFTSAYRDYLRVCIKILEPRLIVTLGIAPAWFVAPLIGPSWRCGLVKSPKMLRSGEIDVEPAQTSDGVIFVAATHPSHANNSRLRTFTIDGDEIQLLARARTMAGISGS